MRNYYDTIEQSNIKKNNFFNIYVFHTILQGMNYDNI